MPNERRTRSNSYYTESEKIYDTLLASFISITINQDMEGGALEEEAEAEAEASDSGLRLRAAKHQHTYRDSHTLTAHLRAPRGSSIHREKTKENWSISWNLVVQNT